MLLFKKSDYDVRKMIMTQKLQSRTAGLKPAKIGRVDNGRSNNVQANNVQKHAKFAPSSDDFS